MKIRHGILALTLGVLLLAACSSTPKIALNPENRQALKRIALIQTAEPARYLVDPGNLTAGYALIAFGPLGGVVRRGIEASRTDAATTRFTEAVSPLKPNLSGILLSQIEKGLRAKGYEVLRVPLPPRLAGGEEYDFSKIKGQFDALLVAELNGGYSAGGGAVAPMVSVTASLLSKSGNEKLFSSTYIYSSGRHGESVQIEPDPKFVLGSVDAIYSDINTAVAGLRAGAAKVAERMVTDL